MYEMQKKVKPAARIYREEKESFISALQVYNIAVK